MYRRSCLRSLVSVVLLLFVLIAKASGQQTLGGITGIVTDPGGGALADTQVSVVGDQTGLARTQKSSGNGFYEFVNLPIGTYTITFTHDGFETKKFPAILVQANRTGTVNALMTVGSVNTSVTVEASPLMNAVDTTNGYVMDRQQIEAVPLPTEALPGLRFSRRA